MRAPLAPPEVVHSVDVTTSNRSNRSGGVMHRGSNDSNQGNVWSIFPLPLCCGLQPEFMQCCIPQNMATLQDWTHLSMVVGLASGFAMVIVGGYTIFNYLRSVVSGGDEACGTSERFYCFGEITILAITPTLFYWYGLIQQYDEDIMKKRAELEDLHHESQQLYNDTLKDMEGLLENQVENNSGLAEKSFDSKKRDFLRFVKAAKQKYQHYFSGSKAEVEQLTIEFRQFVRQWLIIFEEASVDPINKPIQLAGANQSELDNLTTLIDIADWVIAKLTATKVNFISNAMQEDQQIIASSKAEQRRIKHRILEAKYGIIMAGGEMQEGSILRIAFEEWKSIAQQAARIRKHGNDREIAALEEGRAFGKRYSLNSEEAGIEEEGQVQRCASCDCTWYRCSNKRAEVDRHEGDDSKFPYVIFVGCASIILQSNEHVSMIMAIIAAIAGLLAFAVQAILQNGQVVLWPQVFSYLLIIVACVVVLIRFESIDEVLRLEAEVKELKARAEALENKAKRMNVFWQDVQNIADLWLHRTVPRLEVVKEAHGHLEDARPEELLGFFQQTNKALQQLENSVGPRQLWLKDGGITDADKKKFGETIHALANNRDLPAVLNGLNSAVAMIANSSRRASLDRGISPAQVAELKAIGSGSSFKDQRSAMTYQLS